MPLWTKDEDEACLSDTPLAQIAAQLGRSVDSVRNRRWILRDGKGQKPETNSPHTASYEEGHDFINVVCASERMLSLDDVIKQFNINLDFWEIEKYKVKTSEGYRKDRQVDWQVRDGVVTTGDVKDTGKMLVVPLYHIEVRFIKRLSEIRAKTALEDMVEDAKEFMPEYLPHIYTKPSFNACMAEFALPDIHFGRLCWGEESGTNYDIKIAKTVVEEVIDKLLSYVQVHSLERILLPLGNDFFNSDTTLNTTTRGTPQQEDVRWQKTFRIGKQLATTMIDKCASVAPVDVLIIPGNHDSQRSFYLGEALSCWYNNNSSVSILNSSRTRKYYPFGKNLIGFCHGYDEKLSALPIIMATEVPDLWANSLYREWHTGHLHQKKDMITNLDESRGVTVRILRSLVPEDAWTFNKGFTHSQKAGEAFLWHPENGLIAQFTASPTYEE
jgi:hypothetical protein